MARPAGQSLLITTVYTWYRQNLNQQNEIWDSHSMRSNGQRTEVYQPENRGGKAVLSTVPVIRKMPFS